MRFRLDCLRSRASGEKSRNINAATNTRANRLNLNQMSAEQLERKRPNMTTSNTVTISFDELELEITGDYTPAEKETRDHPGSSSEFDITNIEIVKGDIIDLLLEKVTIEKIQDKCREEIETQ